MKMKKLLTAAAASLLVAGGAFAEVTVGTWMRVQAAMVASDGNDTYAGMQNSWGGGARTGRIDVHGVDEAGKVGFETQVFLTVWDSSVAFDQIYFWVQPIEQIRFSAGKFDDTAGTRGDLCYGSWNWMRPYNYFVEDEGLTFDAVGFAGTLLEVFPIEGLQIFWALPLDTDAMSSGNTDNAGDAFNSAWNDGAQATFCSSAVGVTYTMADVFKAKLAYFGDYCDNPYGLKDGGQTGTIQVAADVMAVENLYVTAGFRYRIADADYMAYNDLELMKIALGASYELGGIIGWEPGFKISASGAVYLYDWNDGNLTNAEDIDHDMRFQFGVGVDFGIIEGLKIEADVRYVGETTYDEWDDEADGYKSTSFEDDAVSFLIGVVYSVGSNGEIGLGFQGATNGNGLGTDKSWSRDLVYEDKFAWAIPIRIGVWF